MADRYWVGGTGTWNTTAGTKWAATSGGTGGEPVPTAVDDVFFDAVSGAVTVTISTNTGAKSINCTGFTGSLAGTIGVNVFGSITFVAGMGFTNSGTWQILATSTITSGGKIFSNLTLSAPAGTVTLGSNLTVYPSNTLALVDGALILNGFNISTGVFSSNTSNTRSIDFGGFNGIALTSTTPGITILNIPNFTGFTCTSGFGGFTRVQNTTATVACGNVNGNSASAPSLFITSGSANITFSTGAGSVGCFFKFLSFGGFTGAASVTLTSSFYPINISEGLSLAGSATFSNFGPNIIGTATIACNSATIGQSITINAAGGTVTLENALSCNGPLTLQAGTFTTSNYTVTVNSIATSTATAKTLDMGSSTFFIAGNFEVASSAITTINRGTSTINMIGLSKSFEGAGQTFYNLNQGGAGTLIIQSSNTFNDFENTVTTGNSTISFAAGTTQTFTNFTYANTAPHTTTFQSTVTGSTFTLSKASGTVNASRLFIKDSVATGGATWNATDSVNLGNNTGWNITASPGRYWVGASSSWDGTAGTKWATSSGGVGGASVPGLVDPVYFDAASGTSVVTTGAGNAGCNSLTCTGFTGTLAGNRAFAVFGNITLDAGMTYTNTGLITLTNITTITSAGKTFGSITLDGVSLTLADNLTISTALSFTLTSGNLILSNFDLSAGSFSSNGAGVRSIAFGSGNINLTSTTVLTVVLSMATATNFTYTGTGGFIRNSVAAATVNFGSSAGGSITNAPNLTINAGSASATLTNFSWFKNTNFTGNAGAVSGIINVAGNLTLGSGGTYTSLSPTFRNTSTVVSNGKSLSTSTVNAPGATVTLADAFALNGNLTLTEGTFTTSGFNVTVGSFASSNSNARFFNLGASAITLTGSGTAFNLATATNMTLNAGTSTISLTSGSSKTFAGGGLTYYNLNQGGLGILTISGSNTFNDIANSVKSNRITFTAGTTQTVSNFNFSGLAGQVCTIRSSVFSSQYTISKANGVVSVDYLDIQDSNVTGGAAWYAGANSTNNGNNTGWVFGALPKAGMFLMFS
jgi:hypothetical protein